MGPSSSVPQSVLELASDVGNFIQYWGFKKIHGQVWAMIFLSKDPIDATTLTKRLKVSKGLISLAIKDLLKYKVIERCGRGEKRLIYYKSNSDLNGVIVQILKLRERVLLQKVSTKARTISDSNDPFLDYDRLAELLQMTEQAQDLLEILIHSDLSPHLESPTEEAKSYHDN